MVEKCATLTVRFALTIGNSDMFASCHPIYWSPWHPDHGNTPEADFWAKMWDGIV